MSLDPKQIVRLFQLTPNKKWRDREISRLVNNNRRTYISVIFMIVVVGLLCLGAGGGLAFAVGFLTLPKLGILLGSVLALATGAAACAGSIKALKPAMRARDFYATRRDVLNELRKNGSIQYGHFVRALREQCRYPENTIREILGPEFVKGLEQLRLAQKRETFGFEHGSLSTQPIPTATRNSGIATQQTSGDTVRPPDPKGDRGL